MHFVVGMAEPGCALGDASRDTVLPAPTASPLHGPSRVQQVLPELKQEAWEILPQPPILRGKEMSKVPCERKSHRPYGLPQPCSRPARHVVWLGAAKGTGRYARQNRQDSQLLSRVGLLGPP